MHLHKRTRIPASWTLPGMVLTAGLMICLAIAPAVASKSAQAAKPETEPTAENALAAEEEIARAIRENDADGIERMLTDDWVVIATTGGLGEGKTTFSRGIKSGFLTRKTFEISEARVKVYGDVAVITTKVKTSGTLQGKPFDVTERQTDVLRWENGGWKSCLMHETKIN